MRRLTWQHSSALELVGGLVIVGLNIGRRNIQTMSMDVILGDASASSSHHRAGVLLVRGIHFARARRQLG